MTTPPTKNDGVIADPDAVCDNSGENTLRIVQQVRQAFREGKHERGCTLAHNAIESGIRHPVLYYLRALGKGQREEYQEALADFENARALAPYDPILIEAFGHCLTMLGRFRESVESFDEAIALRPDFVRAHYRKGVALGLLNELDEMRAAHRRVLEFEPSNTDALASLAFIAARKGEIGDARTLGEKAKKVSPRHGIAGIALAITDIHEGRYSAAEKHLAGILSEHSGNQDGRLNMALGFAADAFDRFGRYREAFDLYAEINARRRRIHEGRFASCRAIEEVKMLTESARHSGMQEVRPSQKSSGSGGHTFLLGFVRSGTTLLETILAGNPQVVASDEHDFLADAANEYLHGKGDLQQLASLDNEALERWRSHYWRAVRATGFAVEGKVFVDKVPLNSIRLPLIARLFPDARVLLAIRDPRDVVLSAFRHRFNMYPASFEFLQLDDCARFYVAVMQLVAATRQKAAYLPVHEIRYEDLIGEFDCTIESACTFIGIDWNVSMRQFQSASSIIDRRSQSAAQVQRGLYRGAVGQWRNYAEQLKPALPTLAPWVERFGYPQGQPGL